MQKSKSKPRHINNTERALLLAQLVISTGVVSDPPFKTSCEPGWPDCGYHGMKMRAAFERFGTEQLELLQKFICLDSKLNDKLEQLLYKYNVQRELEGKRSIAF